MATQLNTIEDLFNIAVSIVRGLPKDGEFKPSDDLKLKFYAYFKQATHGPNDTPKPKFYQLVESYKWDAWKKLEEMSKKEAMMNYIRELKQVIESVPKGSNSNDVESFKETLNKNPSLMNG